jgi:hypothetical protein
MKTTVKSNNKTPFWIIGNGVLVMKNIYIYIYILKKKVLREDHESCFKLIQGAQKYIKT